MAASADINSNAGVTLNQPTDFTEIDLQWASYARKVMAEIPHFYGKSGSQPTFEDFEAAINRYIHLVPLNGQRMFLAHFLTKIHNPARYYLEGKLFKTVDDVMKVLSKRYSSKICYGAHKDDLKYVQIYDDNIKDFIMELSSLYNKALNVGIAEFGSDAETFLKKELNQIVVGHIITKVPTAYRELIKFAQCENIEDIRKTLGPKIKRKCSEKQENSRYE